MKRGEMVTSMRPDRLSRPPLGWQGATALFDVRFVFVPEVFQRGQNRCNGGVTERTQRLAGHISGNTRKQIQVARLAIPPFDPPENLVQPISTLTTRRALAAGFVAIEEERVLPRPYHS